MKNLIFIFINKKNSGFNLMIVGLMLLGLVLGCSDSGDSGSTAAAENDKKSIPAAYVGVWTGQDGSTITFRNDSTGDYKSGGTTVSGAAVEVDEAANEIRFTLLGFDSGKYKIDSPPAKNRMKLDGMEYRRAGGFDASQAETSDAAAVIPPEAELRSLLYESLTDFSQAIKNKDFTDFYSSLAQKWQHQTTVATFDEAFANQIKGQSDYTPKSLASLQFSPAPAIENKNYLDVIVKYVTVKGITTRFQLRYVQEDGEWKLFGIELNPGERKFR